MKIKIVNFGPIKEFEFDFSKKLIVTYGDNNIGKSYAMQVAYLLLKKFIDTFTLSRNYNIIAHEIYNQAQKMVLEITSLLEKNVKGIVTKEEVHKEIESAVYKNIANNILYDFKASCLNTFGNFDKILGEEPHIYILTEEYNMDIDLKNEIITGSIPKLKLLIRKSENEEEIYGDNKLEFVIDFPDDGGDILPQVKNKLAQVNDYILFDIVNLIGRVYFLPASRSGIYSGMNAFGAIVAELSKKRTTLTSKLELPGISEPISDYFIELSNISNNSSVNSNTDKRLKDCYSRIEESILGGQVFFDNNKSSLVYAPKDMDTQFTMTEVSSMVSEVSPIVAFLKYIIANRQSVSPESRAVLFIEEPEAHLHPNNQIKLMEVFTELADAGITLVMSSHSNYVFNKLNNLVLSGKLDYNIYQPIFLEKGTDGSISKPMHIDECGADDENFIDVSEALYNEREQIIQKHNEGMA